MLAQLSDLISQHPAAAALTAGAVTAGAAATLYLRNRSEAVRAPNCRGGQVHLVGSGVASLSAVSSLLQHGVTDAKNIHVYDERSVEGGSCDGSGDSVNGYVLRGGRMIDTPGFAAMLDFLSRVPSIEPDAQPGQTCKDDYFRFNTTFVTDAKARLVLSGGKREPLWEQKTFGFTMRDRLDLLYLMTCSEAALGRKSIEEVVNPHLLTTPFWYMWKTTFAFQDFHSAVELKRYMHRWQHLLPTMFNLGAIKRTRFNQYDSIALPAKLHFEKLGVQFHLNTRVVDAKFGTKDGSHRCESLSVLRPGASAPETVKLGPNDSAIFTIGSITADSALGTHKMPAPKPSKEVTSQSFQLWLKMAKQLPKEVIGNPENFVHRIPESAWQSFTCTFRDPTFMEYMRNYTGNEPGTGALVTIVDSPWLMSSVIGKQPHFLDQPKDVSVTWGYALNLTAPGKFVKKPITDCSGEEILTELLGHLGMPEKEKAVIMKTTTVIPCHLPYIVSMFMTRSYEDRPKPVHPKATNFGFTGQFVEIKDDCVFLVDSSVRSGMMAVKGLYGVKDLKVPAIAFPSDPMTLLGCARAFLQ